MLIVINIPDYNLSKIIVVMQVCKYMPTYYTNPNLTVN